MLALSSCDNVMVQRTDAEFDIPATLIADFFSHYVMLDKMPRVIHRQSTMLGQLYSGSHILTILMLTAAKRPHLWAWLQRLALLSSGL